LNAAGKDFAESPISAEHLGALVGLIGKGELSGKLAKEIFPKMFAERGSAARHHGARRADADQRHGRARKDCRRSDCGEPKQVEQYKGGKTTVMGFWSARS
jgi:aspartyl-tRNA(Asn)/glutamyl-tRNA(Gln) amidotransferase subunit B